MRDIHDWFDLSDVIEYERLDHSEELDRVLAELDPTYQTQRTPVVGLTEPE